MSEGLFNANLFLEEKLDEAKQKIALPENYRYYTIESVAQKDLLFTDDDLFSIIKYKYANREIEFLGQNNPDIGIIGKSIRWAY